MWDLTLKENSNKISIFQTYHHIRFKVLTLTWHCKSFVFVQSDPKETNNRRKVPSRLGNVLEGWEEKRNECDVRVSLSIGFGVCGGNMSYVNVRRNWGMVTRVINVWCSLIVIPRCPPPLFPWYGIASFFDDVSLISVFCRLYNGFILRVTCNEPYESLWNRKGSECRLPVGGHRVFFVFPTNNN